MWRSSLWSWASVLLASVLVNGDPDFYSAWCPCTPRFQCDSAYGSSFDDIVIFGTIPPCKSHNHVRCCSAQNIPEGFDLSRPVQYFPASVRSTSEALLQGFDDPVDPVQVSARQDVQEYKKEVEILKRAIARGETNPNPPCGCYTAGTCPGRYSSKSTGRDVGCLDGFETCCFLDDPWPDYKVTNLTINAPCSTQDTCTRFFGSSPFDISSFGALEPCYLGQNRCVDFLIGGASKKNVAKVPTSSRTSTARPTRPVTRKTTRRPSFFTTTRRPTTSKPVTDRTTTRKPFTFSSTYRTPITYRTTSRNPVTYRTTTKRPTTFRRTTRRPITYRPTTRRPITYRPTTRRPITYRPTTRRPITYRPTTKRTTTYRPTTKRPITYRPTTKRPITYRPTTQKPTRPRTRPTPARFTFRPFTNPRTTTTIRTTTDKQSQAQPYPSGNKIIDFVSQGAYLPPSSDFGSADDRNQLSGLNFALPF